MKNNTIKESVSLKNETVSLRFRTTPHVYLAELSDLRTRRSWARPVRESPPLETLWRIALISPDGTSPVYDSLQGQLVSCELSPGNNGGGEIRFSWNVKATPRSPCRVAVRVRCCDNKPQTYWSVTIEPPETWRVLRVDFPLIQNIRLKKNSRILVPSGWGLEHDLVPGFRMEGHYPSWEIVLQMMAFLQEGSGLYIGTHDKNAFLKDFCLEARRGAASFWIRHFPEGGKTDAPVEFPYEVILQPFHGGYYEAAQIYRPFSLETPWGSAGNIANRPDIPEWLKQTCLWLRPDGAPEANRDITKQALDFFDVPTALHWYRWHQIPYDTLYPEYFPPKEGFKESVEEFQQNGTHVMPYINGRLCDPETETWRARNGDRSAARRQDGSCYTEVYGSLVPNNVMCPAEPFWQDTIAGLVNRMIGELGVQGVYIDQIGAAAGVPCYHPDHNHAPGGGAFWHEGYRKTLRMIRDEKPRQVILTTEENAECWLDLFDAHLVVNTPFMGRHVPLFPAVYSERSVLFGSAYYAPNEPSNALPFRLKNAWALLWGSQPGWISPQKIMPPEARREAEFLRILARARKEALAYLLGGRFLGEAEIKGDFRNLEIGASHFGTKCVFDNPPVMGTLWQSQEGKIALLLVNISDNECNGIAGVPKGRLRQAVHFSSIMILNQTELRHENIESPDNQINFKIAPCTVQLFTAL
ncbi:hypothetical protein JW926_06200 [Candidatus Sumerlaeota bacterium]|nr:hypothetical protein [Candidatus Sumerlaeota bacterium]